MNAQTKTKSKVTKPLPPNPKGLPAWKMVALCQASAKCWLGVRIANRKMDTKALKYYHEAVNDIERQAGWKVTTWKTYPSNASLKAKKAQAVAVPKQTVTLPDNLTLTDSQKKRLIAILLE